MKRFLVYVALSIFWVFQTTTSAFSMMGGGGGMGGGQMGGGMGGGMGSGQGYGRQYERPQQYPYSEQPSRYNRQYMTRSTAEELARNYMMGRYGDTYRLGELKDHDTYYMAEIHGPNGNLTERLLIDKQTGNIHSLQR